MGIAFKTPDTDNDDTHHSSDDVVARFRSGFQTSSGRPVSLDAFRVTTGDPAVAEAISEIMGATDDGVTEWETKTEEKFQVFTTTSDLDLIVEPGAVKAALVLWSRNGKKIVETDGEYLIEEGKLTDKPWPGSSKTLKEMKKDAEDGTGPGPSLQLYFHIKGHESLGKLKYFSGSWTAIDSFNKAEEALEELGGPSVVNLTLERVEFTRKDGIEVSFVRPALKVIGLVEEVTS